MLHWNQILSANQSYDFVEPQSLLWRSWDRKTQRAPHRPRRGGNKAPMCVPRVRTSYRLILEQNSKSRSCSLGAVRVRRTHSVSLACGGSGIILLLLTAPFLTLRHTHTQCKCAQAFIHTHTQTYKTVAFLSLSWLCAAFCPANRLLSLFQMRHPQVRSKATHRKWLLSSLCSLFCFCFCSKLHSEFVHQFEACKNERHDSLCFLCHVFSFL